MTDLNEAAVAGIRLQNSYALAIDARDWDLFQTVFTPDVRARYPHGVFNGMTAWLENFIPFHDTCEWTLHELTNHTVGEDGDGVWAVCYGWIRWTMKDNPGFINRSEVIFRDRLVNQNGTWRIARRKLDQLSSQHGVPVPAGHTLLQSVLDLNDFSASD